MIIWSQTDKVGITAEVSYASGFYEVKVFKGSDILVETFKALYEPRFGMDIEDRDVSMEMAEALAFQLEEMLDARGRGL
jgi:hypothetical protein